jgi:hypothetical protein
LYDKIYRADILTHAYNLVRANKGSAGIDGVTFEAIETGEGITAFLAELEDALKNKTYLPDPVKRVMIPKANGEKRPMGIPTIRDRVTQMAVKLVIKPIFETDFCKTSYGFRPKKSAHDAINNDVTCALHRGHTEVITNYQRPSDATYGKRTNRAANGLDSERSQCHCSRLGWLLPLSQWQQNNDSFTSACGAVDDDTLAEATQGQRQEYGIRQI